MILHFDGGPLELPSHWPACHPGPHPTSRSTPGVVPEAADTVHMTLLAINLERRDELEDRELSEDSPRWRSVYRRQRLAIEVALIAAGIRGKGWER